ncbi:MAG TPA: hypothetical protein VHE35_17345 [Kofleriaceae bacterium]|nr:hypothetical protein [Kofleriaceae bacterium]
MRELPAWVRRLSTRPAAALVALLLGTYAYFYQAGGWNQNSRFDLVRAMVEDGALRTDRFAKNTGDDAVRRGHHYCDKAPGSSWLCAPTYAAFYWLSGAPKEYGPSWLGWAAWLSIVVAVSVPSAIAAVFLARLARALGLERWAQLAVALVWGLASLGLPYSTLLYGNQLAASFLLIGFTLLVEVRGGARPTAAAMLVAGGCLGLAGACEYPAALVMAPIAVYGLAVLGRRRAWAALGWAAVGGAIPLAALAVYHARAFGSPGAFPYDFSVWKEPHVGFMGIGVPKWPAIRGTFVGEHRGLLYAMPWIVLAVPGAVVLARRSWAEVAVCAWAVIAFVWLNVSIKPWHGGWATGPRYVVPMLPFLVVLCGGVLGWVRRPRDVAAGWRRAAMAAAIVVGLGAAGWSAAHMFAATVVKPEITEKELRPYHHVVWPNFRRGRFSISTQSIDMRGNPDRAPRQAWNLGMKAGLDGHASLVPLYLWWILCALWLRRAWFGVPAPADAPADALAAEPGPDIPTAS